MGERILRVENDQWVAHAVYRKVGQHWVCWATAPALYWLMHTPVDKVKRFLQGPGARKGWRYCWLPVKPDGLDVSQTYTKERRDGRPELHDNGPEGQR